MTAAAKDTTQTAARREARPRKVRVHGWAVEVVGGPDRGKRFDTLDTLVRIGSDPSNDIVLTDPTVSRRHLEFERTEKGLLLRDLGSRNGAFVEGRRVLQAYVEPGEKIEVGKTRLLIRREAKPTPVELSETDTFGELVGASESMRAAFALLRSLASQNANLLIEGETGTGKELAARAVHGHSPHAKGPFQVVDCNVLSDLNASDALFGTARYPGAFEAAAGGTVYLDEVGELPSAVQPKLLRILEAREVRRTDQGVAVPLDVRVIASTQRNLEEDTLQGRFRKDLYFRLAATQVRLPPLRARRGDIPVLAKHFLRHTGTIFDLTDQTLALLEGYDWPGNVRELRNVLERGALTQETGYGNWLDFLAHPPKKGGGAHASVRQRVIGLRYDEARDRVLGDFERFYFAEVMKQAGFDIQVAEERTGLSMQSLYRLLKKNGLRLKELKNAEEVA